MYILITSSKDSDDLSIGLDRNRERRRRDLKKKQKFKGKYQIKLYSKDIFGSAEHQLKAMLGLGYRLVLPRNTDNVVLNKEKAINSAKIKSISFDLYMPHYTPSPEQQTILSEQIVNKTPTELQFTEGSGFMKQANTQKLRTIEIITQEGIKVPLWIIVRCQQSDRQHDQILNNDTF